MPILPLTYATVWTNFCLQTRTTGTDLFAKHFRKPLISLELARHQPHGPVSSSVTVGTGHCGQGETTNFWRQRRSGGIVSKNSSLDLLEQICLQSRKQKRRCRTGLFAPKPENRFLCTRTGFVCKQPLSHWRLVRRHAPIRFCYRPFQFSDC